MALTSDDLEKWNADTNYQITYHGPTLLRICGHHGLHPSNFVEAAVDAERTGWDRNIKRDLNTGCCQVTENE